MKRFLKASSVILAATGVQRVANFVFFAYVTVKLTPQDYSAYNLFLSLISLLTLPISIGIPGAPSRLMFEFKPGREQNSFLRAGFWWCLIFALVLAPIVSYCVYRIPFISENLLTPTITFLLALTLIFSALSDYLRAALRGLGTVFPYVAVSLARQVGVLGFVFLVGIVMHLGLESLSWAILLSTLLSLAVAIWCTRFIFDSAKGKAAHFGMLWKFSLPLVFYSIFGWIILNSGKWVGSSLLGLAELAPFMLVMQYDGIVGMTARALFEARCPEIGEAASKRDFVLGKKLIANTSLISTAFVAAAFIAALAVLSYIGFRTPNGIAVGPYILFLALMLAVSDIFSLYGYQITLLKGSTKRLGFFTALIGCLGVLVSIPLVKHFKNIEVLLYVQIASRFALGFCFIWVKKGRDRNPKIEILPLVADPLTEGE